MTLSIKRQAFLSLLFEKKYKIFISKPLILICSIEIVGKILLSHPGFLLTRKKIRKRLSRVRPCLPPPPPPAKIYAVF